MVGLNSMKFQKLQAAAGTSIPGHVGYSVWLAFSHTFCYSLRIVLFHDGVVLMMPLCLEYHLLGFHQLPPKLNLTPRPLNMGKSYIFIAFMNSLTHILQDSIK